MVKNEKAQEYLSNYCRDNPDLKQLADELIQRVEAKTGKAVDSLGLSMILDCMLLEDVKRKAGDDIAARGFSVDVRNGRQHYQKDNPSATLLLRYIDKQRKILTSLGIAVENADEDGGETDEFDEI